MPAGDTSHTSTLTLRACSTGGGIVTATLLHDGASVDTDTHSLTVTAPPRVVTPPTPAIRISGLLSTMDTGDNHPFTVEASNLNSSRTYKVRVSASNGNVSFDSNCTLNTEETQEFTGETSKSVAFVARACAAPGATITAELLRGTATVSTARHSLTVTRPPIPTTGPNGETLEIDGLKSSLLEEEYDFFWVYAENLDSGTSYVIRVTTSNANAGLNSDCSDQQDDESVPAGDTRDRLGSLVYACAPPGGTVTASLVVDGSPIAAVTQYVTVEPDLRPTVALDMPFGIYSVGARHSPFTVSAEKLDASKSYRILLTLADESDSRDGNGENRVEISFDNGCSIQEKVLTVPANSTSHAARVYLEACDATKGTLTAELQLVGGTEDAPTYTKVVETSETVKSSGSVRPRLYGPANITVGAANKEKIGFILESLDSVRTYTVVFETSNGIGFGSDCADDIKIIVLTGKTNYSVTASVTDNDFTGKDTIYGCTVGRGSLTAKVYPGNFPQESQLPANAHRNEYHTVNVRN